MCGFQLTVSVMACRWLFNEPQLVADKTCVNELVGTDCRIKHDIRYYNIILIDMPTGMSHIKTKAFT
jgi:hypothetical protein